MSIFKKLSDLEHKILAYLGGHQAEIVSGLQEAQLAVKAATAVAAITETGTDGKTPAIVTTLSGVSDGLGQVAAAVTAETTATTFSQHAAALTGLATGLIQTTNDVGVKNADTKAAIGVVLLKVNSVVDVLQSAAANAQAPVAAPPVV
jgi:hypothetical protein